VVLDFPHYRMPDFPGADVPRYFSYQPKKTCLCMSVNILQPVASGRWLDSYGEVLSEEEMDRIRELQDMTNVHFEMSSRTTRCCGCWRLLLNIGAQGDITSCPFVPYVLGNVRQHALANVWKLHAAAMKLKQVGACPMNGQRTRAALRSHADSVAAALGYSAASRLRSGRCC
jgi:MoaA/NifB/PqqE/SkfB family radical SAM enzyme